MNIIEEIKVLIIDALKALGIDYSKEIVLEHPDELGHGDYSSNIAFMISKELKKKPVELAGDIVEAIKTKLSAESRISKIEVAGPGFINFFLADRFVAEKICSVVNDEQNFGHSSVEANKKVIVEYTDPNTFKVFHIGHLMANAIGESIARLIESSGAKVFRVCYPSDIGLHIAKAIWAIEKNISNMPDETVSIQEKTDFLGKMYVLGTKTYDEDLIAKKEIDELNKKIYEKSDTKINDIYEKGRKWSLDHFELIYKLLGTKFDKYIYESEMAEIGKDIVRQNLIRGIFEISEGATVFKGEKYSLHTRVFINSQGLPTYEAKDLGLNVTKFKDYPDLDESIIITANEQNDYFKVLKQVFLLIDEKNGSKTRHIGHGMMRFLSGKMSSRTGNVVTAEALISDIKDLVKEKIQDRKFNVEEIEEIANVVAVGAIKYTILRSSVGSNIIFDSASSISFEGDSGPYLQYSAVRAQSILDKAKEVNISSEFNYNKKMDFPEKANSLEKKIIKFEEVVARARSEYAPQTIATYLVDLAGEFNSFYASQVIIDNKNPLSHYFVILTKAFLITMTNGLDLLGIKVPRKM